jgi:hypothetical protein
LTSEPTSLYICSVNRRQSQAIAALKKDLEEAFPQAVRSEQQVNLTTNDAMRRLETGLAPLDEVLGGGLPLGFVSAWSGRVGSGLTSLLHVVVQGILEKGDWVALVDPSRSLYPRDWGRESASERLWILHPESREEAFWAAEQLAASGGFRLVMIDTRMCALSNSVLGKETASRLRQAAQKGGGALLVLGGESPKTVGANLAIDVHPVSIDEVKQRWTLQLVRCRGGTPVKTEVSFDVQDRVFACRLSSHSLVPDRRASSQRNRR